MQTNSQTRPGKTKKKKRETISIVSPQKTIGRDRPNVPKKLTFFPPNNNNNRKSVVLTVEVIGRAVAAPASP
jgi:hypothetical protein